MVLSATEFETRPLHEAASELADRAESWPHARKATLSGVPVVFAVSGIGKANAAAAVGALSARGRPVAFLQVGLGGAYPGAGIEPGQAALASTEIDLDLGVGRHPEWSDLASMAVPGVNDTNRIDLRSPLLRRVAQRVRLPALDFATSDSVTASAEHAGYLRERFGVAVESMEGAGAARAAAALGLHLVEIRGVSNVVGDRNRSKWRMVDAVTAACAAAVAAIEEVWEVANEPVG